MSGTKASGRRSLLLKPHVRQTILEYIGNGNYIKTACLAAGIHPATYCNWQQWAEQYAVRHDNGNARKKIYYEFFEELKNAEAKAEATAVARIDAAGTLPHQWQANAWRLERKNPELWGKREVLEIGPSKVLVALQEQARLDVGKYRLLEGENVQE